MSTTSTGQVPPVPKRTDTVFMGRQDFFSVVLRLIGVELYKIRRRMLSKVLASIAIGAAIGIFLINFSLVLLFSRDGGPSQVASTVAVQLGLPTSLSVVVQTILTMGRILIITLAGIIVGEEYGVGTVRLMLTRGPTRIQFLLAKVGTLLACSGFGVFGMTVLGVLTGQLFTPFTPFRQSFDFLNAVWIGHAFLLILYLLLGLIVYALMALFFATLGKATAAGIGITLVWVLVVEVLGETLGFVGKAIQGTLGTILVGVSKCLIGPNIDALLQNQSYYLFSNTPSPSDVSDVQALLVFAFYLVLFVGLSWWIIERRDVTN